MYRRCPLQVEQRLQAQLGLLAAQVEQQGDEEAARLPGLQASLARLQSAAEEWEVRLLRLEAQRYAPAQQRHTSLATLRDEFKQLQPLSRSN